MEEQLSNPTPPPRRELRFADFPQKERWKMMWGVLWRIWVASFALTLIFMFIMLVFMLAVGISLFGGTYELTLG